MPLAPVSRPASFIRLLATTLLLYLCVLAGNARADTVFSNLGAGGSFNTAARYHIDGSDLGTAVDIAGQFTVGASSYTLTSADLALDHWAGPNLLDVFLISDSLGTPNPLTVLTSGIATGIPNALSPALINVTFGASITLAANTTYWLAASAPDDANRFGWYVNNTGDTGQASRPIVNPGLNLWVTQPTSVAPAFRINGTAISGPGGAPVPTPTAAAGGIALMGMLIAKRRRQQQA